MTALRWPAKRAVDVLGAVGGLIVLGPLLVLFALAVRRTLGSPVLLRQVRAGRHGRPFQLLKFRTRTAGIAPGGATLPEWQLFRGSAAGCALRASTACPALINVLRGDMSLVGPRPLPPGYLPHCSAKQARRHELRPGMTGWAAVQEAARRTGSAAAPSTSGTSTTGRSCSTSRSCSWPSPR